LLVIIIKPIITFIICTIFGYTKKTAFMTAGALPQISEFGMIIVAQGIYDLGHLDKGIFTLVVMLAMCSIVYTTYLVKYEAAIYNKLALAFKFKSTARHLEYLPEEFNKEVLLVGYHRIGYSIFKTLGKLRKEFVVIDFNPDVIKKLIREKIHCIYGDAADSEILERVHLDKVKVLISTIPDLATNTILIRKTKELNNKALILVTANHVPDALELYELGADYVILPHLLGGQHVSLLLEEINDDFSKLILAKMKHINELNERVELGHHLHHDGK
jgi:voltage-gated potassium channel Kch